MTKNIAFLHKDFPHGGAERITTDIAEYTSHHGRRSFIFTWHKSQDERIKEIEQYSAIIELPDQAEEYSAENAQFVIQKIKEHDISIFLIPIYEMPYLPRLREEAKSCKFIFSYHGAPFCEAIYMEHWETERHTLGWPLRKRLEWKYIRNLKYRMTGKYKKIVKASYERTYNNVDAFVVVCEAYKDTLVKELHLDPKQNKLLAIQNPEKEVPHPNLKKKKQIIFVGRMTYPDKRVDRLVRIWEKIYREVPDWELLLIGEGAEKEKLEKLSEQLALQRIHFMGHCAHVEKYYRDAAVLCLTSTTESWGLCLTEAQANGVIPIAFGCSEGIETILVPSGVNGIIVPPFSLKKYAEALLRLLKNDSLREEMQKNVLRKAKEYSMETVGKKWLELFERLT